MKRTLILLLTICALLLGAALPGLAAEGAVITEYDVFDDRMVAYVKNAGGTENVSAALGHYPCEGVSAHRLSDSGTGIRTLILIDNSLSIPAASRNTINDEITRILAARKNGEQFALGTISEDVAVAQEFTDDYTALKKALDSVEYKDQETYITDALYDYLSENPFASEQSAYTRILLFSDGVDNKSIGYTKDELLTLLKGRPFPIYSVGVRNAYNNNTGDIENMFALSRATGAGTFLLNEIQGKDTLAEAMAADWENLAVSIPLPPEARDGSSLTLTLSAEGEGGWKVSQDGVRMPNVPLPKETAAPATPTPAPSPTPEPVVEEKGLGMTAYLLIGIGMLAVAGIVVALILIGKKNRQKKSFQTLAPDELNRKLREEDSATVMMGGGGATELMDGEATLHFWDNNVPTSYISLTDVHDMQRRFKKPITSTLVIGLSSDCDICINYDKTVSRRHCEISKEDDGYYITNLSSSNGTVVNNNRITEKTRVSDGAMLKLGKVELRLEIEE